MKKDILSKAKTECTQTTNRSSKIKLTFYLVAASAILISAVIPQISRGKSKGSPPFEEVKTESETAISVIDADTNASISFGNSEVKLSESKLGDIKEVDVEGRVSSDTSPGEVANIDDKRAVECLPDQSSGYQMYFLENSMEYIEVAVKNTSDSVQSNKNCTIFKIKINKLAAPSYDISSFGLFSWSSSLEDLEKVFDVEPIIYSKAVDLYTFELRDATYKFTYVDGSMQEIEIVSNVKED